MKDRLRAWRESVSAKAQVTQRMLFMGGAGLVCIGVLSLVFLMKSSPAPTESSSSKPKEIQINSANRSILPQEVWVDRIEREREILSKRLEQLEKLVNILVSQTTADNLQDTSASSQNTSSQNPQDGSSVDGVRQELRNSASKDTAVSQELSSQSNPVSRDAAAEAHHSVAKPVIRRISFQLNPAWGRKLGQTVDHYVPAGSFVAAHLTSGVVAKTSIDAAGNPQPIHMEITDFGNLPRFFKTDIKACFVTGAAYGDIAAERVFVRLERFSCVERKTGEVIEATVEGYVVGEDGANGLRGHVIDRSGPAIRNAFIGGFLSGMGGFFAQSHNTPLSIAPGGMAAINSLPPKQMLETGAAKGMSSAMEKYADFYVKRAEQTQPVIEIEAGRYVDIVFQKGFDLNQTFYRKSLIEQRGKDVRDTTYSTQIQKEEIP